MHDYDFIICGGGGSGLSLAHRFCDEELRHFKVLIIDKDVKEKNDRTWCSWVKGSDRFDEIAVKKWSNLSFFSPRLNSTQDAAPYHYRMIRGIDFYQHVHSILQSNPNTHRITGVIESIEEHSDNVKVQVNGTIYSAQIIFKSYTDLKIDKIKSRYLDQHFKGWVIETSDDAFDANCCTLMDFRIDQENDFRFFYVLPIDARKALVEIAIFSAELLPMKEYDRLIKDYIRNVIKMDDYKITEEEFGVIPMTDFPYHKRDTDRIIHIGTGGGVVKPSTGYAFTRIQRHSDAIKHCLVMGIHPGKAQKEFKPRYRFFDSILLQVLINEKSLGYKAIEDLFRKNTMQQVFDFLDEDANLIANLRTMWACDKPTFIKAFFQTIFH